MQDHWPFPTPLGEVCIPQPHFSSSSATGSSQPCRSMRFPFLPRPPKKGAVCVGPSTQDLCWRGPGAEELCEPSCLAPAWRGDVGCAGRNGEFLRGRSSHSCAGRRGPPAHEPVSSSYHWRPFPWHLSRAVFLFTRRGGSKPFLPAPEPTSRDFSQPLYFSSVRGASLRLPAGGSPAASRGAPGKQAGGRHGLVLGLRFPASKSIRVTVLFTPLSAA